MNTEFTDFENENIFDNIEKLKKELYSFESLFEVELNKILSIIEIYNNRKGNSDCEDIKHRIGIMGQVNSGKSSFLNALIFNGENILPKDCISKTKIITKINYSDVKRLEVEFYTKREWEEIKNILIKEGEVKGLNFVKEVFEFMNASEYDVEKYINKDNEIINFQNYDELLEKIVDCDNRYNNYRFPIKAMNIYIDDIRLKNIEILDTPGVNDSNLIRKYTIDKCFRYVDVVFFLSQASIFLDNLDVNMISNQMPRESASNVFLIASKYDTAIIDEGWKFTSLFETDKYIKSRLTNRVRKYVSKYIINSTPIFMSAMANNLALKTKDNYNKEENYVINQLNGLWNGCIFDKEKLMFVGNFEDVKSKINGNLDIKGNIISKLKVEFGKILCDIKETSKQRIYVIENSDMKDISIEQEKIKLKTQKIYKGIEKVIENTKELAINEKKQMEEQLGVELLTLCEIKVNKKTIRRDDGTLKNNPKWYEVFLRKENSTETDDSFLEFEYEWVDIDEVISNINNFISDAYLYVKNMMDTIIRFDELKENAIKIVCEFLDENNEKLKPNEIKVFVESSIGSTKISNINIDIEEYIEIISSKFEDEITGQAIDVLNLNFKAVMKKIYHEIIEKVDVEFKTIMLQLDKFQIVIMKYILEIMNNRVERLKNESSRFNGELKSYKKIIRIIDQSNCDLGKN